MFYRNVLFVCTRCLWRSPTAERIYASDPRIAVRSRGLSEQAAQRLSTNDLDWADLVLVMQEEHLDTIRQEFAETLPGRAIHVLDIPGQYKLMDPRLVRLIQDRVEYYLSPGLRVQPQPSE